MAKQRPQPLLTEGRVRGPIKLIDPSLPKMVPKKDAVPPYIRALRAKQNSQHSQQQQA